MILIGRSGYWVSISSLRLGIYTSPECPQNHELFNYQSYSKKVLCEYSQVPFKITIKIVRLGNVISGFDTRLKFYTKTFFMSHWHLSLTPNINLY